MRFTDKYKGNLPVILHSPAEFALRDRPMSVSAAYRVQNGKTPDKLYIYVKNGGKYAMQATDSYTTDVNGCRTAYEIYTGSIPTENLKGDTVEYYVGEDCYSGDFSDCLSTKLYSEDKLPPEPALILTEIYERPKGRGFGYLEVMNPSDNDTDLYDYEFLIFDNKTHAEGNPTCRLPMSDEKGKNVLAAGEFAAIWGITEKNLDKNGRMWCTSEDFLEDFNGEFTNRNLGVTAEEARIIPVKYYKEDETGKKTSLDGIADVPTNHRASVLYIVPRGKDTADAIYTCVYSTCFGSWDTPVKRSSYWKTDVRNPSSGVNICHYAMATPGFAGRGQAKHNVYAGAPVIIPIFPDSNIYIGDGDCDVRFACIPTDGTKITDARIFIENNGKEEKIEAYEAEDGLFHATVPYEFIRSNESLTYRCEASDGTRTYGSKGEKISVFISDNEGPCIIDMVPSEGYAYDGRAECEIKTSFYDVSGVDVSSCLIKLDGKNITPLTRINQTGLRYSAQLKAGGHRLHMLIFDNVGNVTKKSVNFTVSDMKELNAYRGQVHCHTADSDGTGTPADAYEYAKNEGGVDFFAVTDHSHYVDKAKYDALVKTADRLNVPGKFAAIYGWEMTWNNSCGFWGHTNVLNTRDYVQNMNNMNEPQLFEWLKKRPESVAMFNHPGYAWGNFDEFAHKTDDADKVHCLSEIKSPAYDFEYMHLLAKGWHAAPVSNEDNHGANWTTATPSDGYVLAPALTRENVIDAFRARRTYVSSDKTLKLVYKVNGEWLGSHLNNPDKLRFEISLSTESIGGIGLVELIGEDDIVVASKNCRGIREFVWKPVLNPDFDYYYLRITSKEQYCVTSPVWIDNREAPTISAMNYTPSYNSTDTAAVSFEISNKTENAMRDVRVAFILSPDNGFRMGEAVSFKTVHIGKLAEGQTVKASSILPECPGLRRVTALVSAARGTKKLFATASLMMCPVQIVGVMPKSSPVQKNGVAIDNPFPYITVINQSPKDIALSGGKICQWAKFGKLPPEDRILATDKIVLKARSSLVIWDRNGNTELTVQDFNERYDTDFVEGESILRF